METDHRPLQVVCVVCDYKSEPRWLSKDAESGRKAWAAARRHDRQAHDGKRNATVLIEVE